MVVETFPGVIFQGQRARLRMTARAEVIPLHFRHGLGADDPQLRQWLALGCGSGRSRRLLKPQSQLRLPFVFLFLIGDIRENFLFIQLNKRYTVSARGFKPFFLLFFMVMPTTIGQTSIRC